VGGKKNYFVVGVGRWGEERKGGRERGCQEEKGVGGGGGGGGRERGRQITTPVTINVTHARAHTQHTRTFETCPMSV